MPSIDPTNPINPINPLPKGTDEEIATAIAILDNGTAFEVYTAKLLRIWQKERRVAQFVQQVRDARSAARDPRDTLVGSDQWPHGPRVIA